MSLRPARVLCLTALVAAGCGRIGVELLALDAGTGEEPAQDSGSPSEPDASGLDANLSPPDAGEPDADLDAAADGALSASDCVMLRGAGAPASYRLGELAALEGEHIFTLVETERCAAPAACGLELGASVEQQACSISPCAMWESADAGAGWFTLRNALSGACLYMPGPDEQTVAVTWECIDSDKVRWQAACAGANTWRIINKLSQKALAGSGTPSADGGVVQSATDSPRARWRIASSPRAYDVIVATAELDPRAEWRSTTLRPGANWAEASFDDRAWSSAFGAFGDVARGSTPIRTPWTSSDIWLRRGFTLASIPDNLSLQIFHDEDAEVFLDGVQIAALSGWSQGYRSVEIPSAIRSALSVGSHTLAVHCRNLSPPQIIDVGLISYTWR